MSSASKQVAEYKVKNQEHGKDCDADLDRVAREGGSGIGTVNGAGLLAE